MIEKITLKAGSAEGQPNLEFEISPITVFVGPNNSGKSKLLQEIETFLKTTYKERSNALLEDIRLKSYSEEEFLEELHKIKDSKQEYDEAKITIKKISPISDNSHQHTLPLFSLILEAKNPNNYPNGTNYFRYFLERNTLKLDGQNRLNILQNMKAGNLRDVSNILVKLFIDDDLRFRLRKLLYEAFSKYYVLDPTNVGSLMVRYSDVAPSNIDEEKSWKQDAVDFHNKAVPIQQFSDGVKVYTGILTALLAGEPKISLVDEPEAFLHPSLAHRLGKEIGKILNGTNNKFFASTHSSSFLMGCVQSGAPLNVVRLTYKNNVATARLLPKEKILTLMRNPLLRSTGVLNGLFFEAVVITESDTDRAFYQEINERLLSAGDTRGINNCLFLNAQNKQTVWEIVKPLRELGIPAAGIIDIDVIKEGGAVFSKLLNGAFIPEINQAAINITRASLLKELAGTDFKKGGGITQLNPSEQEGANNFFNQLNEYGAFTVRGGELESWLRPLGVNGHGPKWLIDIFEKMGDNPTEQDYIKPSEDDVWDFIGSINDWLDNPSRKGIPL